MPTVEDETSAKTIYPPVYAQVSKIVYHRKGCFRRSNENSASLPDQNVQKGDCRQEKGNVR
jgi:hypothetical protein